MIAIGLVEADSNATAVPFASRFPEQLEKPRAEGMEIDDRNMYPSRPSISAHSISAAVVRCEVEWDCVTPVALEVWKANKHTSESLPVEGVMRSLTSFFRYPRRNGQP